MSWQQIPKDNAWKSYTVATTAALGQRLWLPCNACGHDILADGLTWCAECGIPADTPMLAIGMRLKCTRCGEKKAHCWGEPYGIDKIEPDSTR